MISSIAKKAKDGIIRLGSPLANELGFTEDKFEGYLWKRGDVVMISLIFSLQEGKGNLSALFKAIEAHGWKIAVPTPFARMAAILKRKGFVPHIEIDKVMGDCEVWQRP